ncbi:Unknown protein [Striga hermonthica]|uniref:C2 NT-type domain-containing protein n=1 Tax=Striga hermonthica TaxID=68872 RepID=A0A9N7NI17_STRHE|nr:Unknown protein [Striga hermonthica]
MISLKLTCISQACPALPTRFESSTETDPKDEKAKKPSLWTWKGLKALTNARARRFNCSFSLLVHSVEGLPSILNDAFLVVHWRRKDGDLMTRPVRVHQGVAEFEENLAHSCLVYGNRSGPHRSARYEPKNFLLYASVYNSPDLDLGRHRVDVTRLLPLTLDELENEKSSGKWTTSFGLSGKARGATVHVSFGYAVVENGEGSNHSVPESPRTLFGPFDLSGELSVIRRVESLPARLSTFEQPSEDVKDLHEVLPVLGSEVSDSVNVICRKVEEDSGKLAENNLELVHFPPDSTGEKVCEAEGGISEFSVVEKGVEVETVVPKDEQSEIRGLDSKEKDNDLCSKESLMKDLETALSYATDLVNDGLDSQEDETDALQREDLLDKLPISDDLIDSVANDFLDMLGIDYSPSGSGSESEPESPRECLLKQFEKDALAHGGLLDLEIENYLILDDKPSLKHDFLQEKPELDTCRPKIMTRASRLEDLESEALMRDWGLNEEAFQHSPPSNLGSFSSPVDFHPPNEVCTLPPLAEGVGPFVRTKNGGFLRSMSPGFFPNASNGGSLVMQVSSPVVVPAEMGCNVMDVLQGLAALGIEKLSVQANRLMPLEDITGRTIQQIAWEAGPRVVGSAERQPQSGILQKTLSEQTSVNLTSFSTNKEYVSLEDLAPLAMEKIEALSLEGLRIQSGMSCEDVPSDITAQSMGEFSVLKGKTSNSGGLQLLDIKDDNGPDGIDGLMGLSLTLDEWMRFDSGEIDHEDLVDERTCKILAAHRATSLDVFRGRKNEGEEKKRRAKGRRHGLLGNNFTVAFMVQLRDPLRDYEPVGGPMLSLVQVGRVFSLPKFRIYGKVPPAGDADEDEEDNEWDPEGKEAREGETDEMEKSIPQYEIMEVAVAGLKVEWGRKKLWGPANQEKSGSRWLLANGMGKKNKHPLMKSSPVVKGSYVQPNSDKLWSISSGLIGQHARKPNVVCRNGTKRFR